MTKRYCIIFQGVLVGHERFRQRMGALGTSTDVLDRMMSRVPLVVKDDLTLGQARRYSKLIREAGGKVAIYDRGWGEPLEHRQGHPWAVAHFERFTPCPRCGQKHLKGETCPRCGLMMRERTEKSRAG
jgi:ribosomal protein L32